MYSGLPRNWRALAARGVLAVLFGLFALTQPGIALRFLVMGFGVAVLLSGILAIAMAKLWKRPVLGGDNDAEAVAVARENAELNGVADLCRFVHAAGLRAGELEERAPFDLVVANILAGPLAAPPSGAPQRARVYVVLNSSF